MIVPAGVAFSNVMVGALVVAILYFAREIFVPIVLAVLLSFVLTPLVRILQHLKIPRALAVIGAVGSAVLVAIGLAAMIMVEVNQLASDLPQYETTLSQKIHSLRGVIGDSRLLKNASTVLKDVDRELNTKEKTGGQPANSTLPEDTQSKTPLPVEVHQPDPSTSDTLVAMVRPLVAPMTMTFIVLIFLIFFLFQREDLRNRFIWLAGSDDLERTTAALDDAGTRLGKLFLTQLILNATFGAVIGLSLAVIGVPSAPLWGLLAMILRFVPYIGSILAAALPITLAIAVGSDWSMALWTIALFAVAETLTGQIVEPLVCGRSAGLSPVAVIVAASFWTWIWGPIGLVLSTPLTLCLVVLARHVERLQFVDIMLGDRPALTPQQAAYQRMLTGDPIEAIEQARSFLKEGSVEAYYESILLGALRLAAADATFGRLDDKRLENIYQTVFEIVEDLSSYQGASNENAAEHATMPKGNVVPIEPQNFGSTVFCIPGLGRLDEALTLVMADYLKRQGGIARTAAAATAIESGAAETVCVCFLENVTSARVDFTVRKLSRQAPSANVIVCLLGQAPNADLTTPLDTAPRSLAEATAAINKIATPLRRREQ